MKKIKYTDLDSRQQENYNFYKVASTLADYGFNCLRLTDDYNGADFIALHSDGSHMMVQLKGRWTIDKKYLGKNIHICFTHEGKVYLYNHDDMVNECMVSNKYVPTDSWVKKGAYSINGRPPKGFDRLITELKLS